MQFVFYEAGFPLYKGYLKYKDYYDIITSHL